MAIITRADCEFGHDDDNIITLHLFSSLFVSAGRYRRLVCMLCVCLFGSSRWQQQQQQVPRRKFVFKRDTPTAAGSFE